MVKVYVDTMASRGSPTHAHATAARIVRAARVLFATRGYDAVSVQDVATRARVNKALVFYHYGNKENLLEAVLRGYYAQHAAVLASVEHDPGADERQRLRRLAEAYFDFIASHAPDAGLVQRHLDHPVAGKRIAEGVEQLYRAFVEAAGPGFREEGPLGTRQLFMTFSAIVVGYFTQAALYARVWDWAPLRPEALAARRAHLAVLVDWVLGSPQGPASAAVA